MTCDHANNTNVNHSTPDGRTFSECSECGESYEVDRNGEPMSRSTVTTIEVDCWGRTNLPETFYVRVQDGETFADAVQRSIARRTRCDVYTFRHDGVSLNGRGEPCSAHYQFSLTRPSRYGGANVHGEGWVSLPMDTREDSRRGW